MRGTISDLARLSKVRRRKRPQRARTAWRRTERAGHTTGLNQEGGCAVARSRLQPVYFPACWLPPWGGGLFGFWPGCGFWPGFGVAEGGCWFCDIVSPFCRVVPKWAHSQTRRGAFVNVCGKRGARAAMSQTEMPVHFDESACFRIVDKIYRKQLPIPIDKVNAAKCGYDEYRNKSAC